MTTPTHRGCWQVRRDRMGPTLVRISQATVANGSYPSPIFTKRGGTYVLLGPIDEPTHRVAEVRRDRKRGPPSSRIFRDGIKWFPSSLSHQRGRGTLFSPPMTKPTATSCGKSTGPKWGTTLVKDIQRRVTKWILPAYLTNVRRDLFFSAYDDTNGYSSCGSPTGPKRDHPRQGLFAPELLGSNPRYLTNVGGTLFFSANDETKRLRVVEVRRRPKREPPRQGIFQDGCLWIYPRNLTNVGGTLFFSAN